MSELIKIFKDFISRDIIYIFGGSSVIISFMYYYNQLNISNLSTFEYVFLCAFGYVIGFIIQETLSMVGIITTAHFKPGKIVKYFYRLFTKSEWEDIIGLDQVEKQLAFYEKAPERIITQIERIITLKHIGTTIGSSFLVSSVILLFKFIETKSNYDLTIFISVLTFSILLIIQSWIKGAQQIKYMSEVVDRINKNT